METKEWQGKTYAKNGDTWEEIATPQAPEAAPTEAAPDKFNAAESALQGFGQGAGFGYVPELQAGAETLLDKLLPQSMGGQRGVKLAEALKQWRGRDTAMAAEDPGTYGLANAAGGMAMTAPLGGAGLKGANMLTRAAKAVGTNAALAAAQNTGDVPDQMGARLEQAKQGAIMGALTHGLGAALSGAGKALKEGRQQLAFKLAGARKAHYKDIQKFKIGDKLEKFMQDEGMLKPGQSFETALEKSNAVVEDTGKAIGQTYKSVTEDLKALSKSHDIGPKLQQTQLSAENIADDVMARAKSELHGVAEGKQALKSLKREMNNLRALEQTGPMAETPFEQVLKYRQSLDDIAGYNKTFNESKTGQKALKIARDVIKEKLDARIANVEEAAKLAGGPAKNRVELLKKLNERYRMGRNVQKMASDRAAGEAAKVNLGLLETIAGTGYAGAEIARGEDPLKAIGKGIVGGIALRQARKYGPGLAYQVVKGAERASVPLRQFSKIPPGTFVSPWVRMGMRED